MNSHSFKCLGVPATDSAGLPFRGLLSVAAHVFFVLLEGCCGALRVVGRMLIRKNLEHLFQHIVLSVEQLDHLPQGPSLLLRVVPLRLRQPVVSLQLQDFTILGCELDLQLIYLLHKIAVLSFESHFPLVASFPAAVHGTLRLQRSVEDVKSIQVVDIAV